MLRIGPETFSRMAATDLEGFVRRLAGFVQARVPGMRDDPPGEVLAEVRRLHARAGGYGLSSEVGVAAFVVTAAYMGLDFDEKFGGAREILFARESEERKARLLEGFVATALATLRSGQA